MSFSLTPKTGFHATRPFVYIDAHVLLNVFNSLRKRDKIRSLLSILSLFQKFNILNNTGAQMLDSIYHMSFKLPRNRTLA